MNEYGEVWIDIHPEHIDWSRMKENSIQIDKYYIQIENEYIERMGVTITINHNRLYDKEKKKEGENKENYRIDHNRIRRRLKKTIENNGGELIQYDELSGKYRFRTRGSQQ